MTGCALTISSYFVQRMPWRPPQSSRIQNRLCWEGYRHTYKHLNTKIAERQLWNEVKSVWGTQVRQQESNVCCSFICSHAARLPGICLEVWGNTGTKHTVTDMLRCLQCGVRADTCGLVPLCMCINAFGGWCCICTVFAHVYCMCMIVYCALTSKVTCQVTLSLTNKPCQEKDLNFVLQLLYYLAFSLGVVLLKSSTP